MDGCVWDSVCVPEWVGGWVKTDFYLEYFWTASDCLEDPLSVSFGAKTTQRAALAWTRVKLCEGPKTEVGVARTKDIGLLNQRFGVKESGILGENPRREISQAVRRRHGFSETVDQTVSRIPTERGVIILVNIWDFLKILLIVTYMYTLSVTDVTYLAFLR